MINNTHIFKVKANVWKVVIPFYSLLVLLFYIPISFSAIHPGWVAILFVSAFSVLVLTYLIILNFWNYVELNKNCFKKGRFSINWNDLEDYHFFRVTHSLREEGNEFIKFNKTNGETKDIMIESLLHDKKEMKKLIGYYYNLSRDKVKND